MNKKNKQNKTVLWGTIAISLISPISAYAQKKTPEFITNNQMLINYGLPIMLGIGILLFGYGVYRWIAEAVKQTTNKRPKWFALLGILLGVVAISLWLWIGSLQQSIGLDSAPGGVGSIILSLDPSSDPALLGASHNVFIARIVKSGDIVNYPLGPSQQYIVEVVDNIKGDLQGTVTVEQEGYMSNGMFQPVEDGGTPLESGSTYLLATRYNAPVNAYTLIASKYASPKLDESKSLDADMNVKELKAAYVDEKLLEADIAHDNTLNSFQSLPPDKKATAQARADEAKTWLEAHEGGVITTK